MERIWTCEYCGSPNSVKVKKCEYCGKSPTKTAKVKDKEKKGKGKEKEVKEESKKKSILEQFKISGRTIKTIAVSIIMLILFFANPYIESIKSGSLEIIAQFIPNIADYWDIIVIIGSLLIIGSTAYVVWHYNSLFLAVGITAGIAVLMISFSMIAAYAESANVPDFFSSFICTVQNLGNTEGMLECSERTVDYGEPDSEKIGNYEVLKASFDTEYTGGIIYKNFTDKSLKFNTYYLNLIVENPNDEPIKNFCIIPNKEDIPGNKNTALIRSGSVKSSEKIKLAYLSTTDGEWMCEDSEPDYSGFEIGPRETLRLVLKADAVECRTRLSEVACEDYDFCEWNNDNEECEFDSDRRTREIEARVRFMYDYAGEGKFDFIIANSDEVIRTLSANRHAPTKSDGPIDVLVYFSPNAYVIREQEVKSFNTIVKLSNEDNGIGQIKELKIIRLSDGILSPPTGTCDSVWGDATVRNTDAFTETLDFTTKRLTKSHLYVCEYEIVGDVDEDGEVVPFIVRADYTYEDTVTRKSIKVYEEEL